MARSTIIECVSCNHSIELTEGIGIFAYPEGSRRSLVMKRSEPDDREAIETIDAHHVIDWYNVSISRDIRECPKCRSVKSYFRTEFHYGKHQTYRSACPCPKCGTSGSKWKTPIEELNCPACGRNGFRYTGFKIMD